MRVNWSGVFPVCPSQLKLDESLDIDITIQGVERAIEFGASGIIMCGGIGEGDTLSYDEKMLILRKTTDAVRGRVPVLSGLIEFSTTQACGYAKAMEGLGVDGLMVAPPVSYRMDNQELLSHFQHVAKSTKLPIMLFNDPDTWGVDLTPALVAGLAREQNIVAIKESSEDVRRVSHIRNLVGDDFSIFAGQDDLVVESVMHGCCGHVAGIVMAFPEEMMTLYNLAREKNACAAYALNQELLPLTALDSERKYVQNVKLAIYLAGFGNETVRSPRKILQNEERERVKTIVEARLSKRKQPTVSIVSSTGRP